MVAAGAPSTRVTVPCTSTCSHVGHLAQRLGAHGAADGQRAQAFDPVHALVVERAGWSPPPGRPRARRSRSTGPPGRCASAEPIWAVDEPIMAALLGSTATEIWGASATASLATLSRPSSILSSRTMTSLASLMSLAFWPLTTTARPPPAPVKSCSEMVTSKPSCATGARASLMSSRALARSTSSASRTVSTALFEARPAKAAWRAWAPVSASPGMVDCTRTTSSFGHQDLLGLDGPLLDAGGGRSLRR